MLDAMVALVCALLLAEGGIVEDVSLRSEGRFGTSPVDPNQNAGTLQIDGLLGVAYTRHETLFSVAYTPQFLTTGGQGPAAPTQFLHGARVDFATGLSSTTRLRFTETAAAGESDFSPLNGSLIGLAPPRTVDPRVPVLVVLAIVQSSTALTLEQALSRQMMLATTLGYLVSGGSDRLAQRFLPLQRGPLASIRLSLIASREDTLALTASGSEVLVTDGTRTQLAGVSGSWRHILDRDLFTEFGLGASAGHSVGQGAVPTSPFPTASASITRAVTLHEGAYALTASALVAPQIDPLTGGVYELGQASGSLGWQPGTHLRLTASGSIGRALSGTQQMGEQLGDAQVAANFVVSNSVTLAAGVRGAWLRPPDATTGFYYPSFQWAVFTSASAAIRSPF